MGPLLDLSASTGLKNLSLCSLKLRRYDHAGGRDLIGHLPPHEYIDWFKMILPPNTFYPLGWVPASLSTLRTSRVTNIRFRFHAGGTCGRDWLALDWAKLVEVLSKHQLFPGLKRATFDVLTGASSQGLILCFIARRVAALKEDKELRFIERRSGV